MALDFGIEIEMFVPGRRLELHDNLAQRVGVGVATEIAAAGVPCYFAGYTHARTNSWKIVTDASISAPYDHVGLELVSPPLGDEGLAQIEIIGRVLQRLGARTNRSCGLHVHIGARGKLTVAAMRKLAKLYIQNEEVIDGLLPPSRRGDNNRYCRSVKNNHNLQMINGAMSPDVIQRAISGGSRYVKLNFAAYAKHGTIEFRQHSGTVDPIKITKWVLFCTSLVELAKRTANDPDPYMTDPSARRRLEQRLSRARKSAIIYQLAMRPEGVTGLEMQEALGAASICSPSIPLTRLGVSFYRDGRRRGHAVYKMSPEAIAQATTLSGLLASLELATEDNEFWTARAALLAGNGQHPVPQDMAE